MSLVERDAQLKTLDGLRQGLPGGAVVLIGAEAGAGKSSLLREFLARCPAELTRRAGRCDDLTTPVSFAPLWDMLDALPGAVRSALEGGGRRAVLTALRDAVRAEPSILVLDDVQWADEATLDLIRHLARRVDDIPLLLCLAYRADEVDRLHPLRAVLGDLPDAVRLDLPPLTVAGVRRLAADTDLDVEAICAKSRGNPFFVTELLAHGGDGSTAIDDAVLARAASLPPSAWQLLETVALAPEGIPLAIVPALAPDAAQSVDRAVTRGLLEVSGPRVRCRHDLVRSALASAVTPLRAHAVHARLVELLAGTATSTAEVGAVAAHAVSAQDAAHAAAFSLRAAQMAIADGSHRESVSHLSNALAHREHLTADQVDGALEDGTREAYIRHDTELALRCAIELLDRTPHDDPRAVRRAWWCSRVAFYAGDLAQAIAFAERAEQSAIAASDELYTSYAHWWNAMIQGKGDEQRVWGERTVRTAEDAGALEIAAHVQVSIWPPVPARAAEVIPRLERGLRAARDAGAESEAARAYNNLNYQATVERRLADADRWFAEGCAWAEAEQLDFWLDGMRDNRTMTRLFQGEWDSALRESEDVLTSMPGSIGMKMCAAVTRATILLRRGDPRCRDARAVVATGAAETPAVAAFAWAVEAERGWMHGEVPTSVVEELTAHLDTGSWDPWMVAPVLFWLIKTPGFRGIDVDPGLLPEPIALEIAGRDEAAADAWRSLSTPFEGAVVDGLSDDPERVREAIAELVRLGADATLGPIRRNAARHGLRGARETTLADEDGLTPRQVEVLRLLGARLSDAEIAARLHLSKKTVGHHVSAVLARLQVADRHEAGDHARERFRST